MRKPFLYPTRNQDQDLPGKKGCSQYPNSGSNKATDGYSGISREFDWGQEESQDSKDQEKDPRMWFSEPEKARRPVFTSQDLSRRRLHGITGR